MLFFLGRTLRAGVGAARGSWRREGELAPKFSPYFRGFLKKMGGWGKKVAVKVGVTAVYGYFCR